jgi:flagellar basal body rod protein FlgC
MNEFGILDLAAGAMAAQRSALECLAHNVAAASISGPQGYERMVPVISLDADQPHMHVRREHHDNEGSLTEMLAVLDAQHSYEADESLFSTSKRLVERTLELDKG